MKFKKVNMDGLKPIRNNSYWKRASGVRQHGILRDGRQVVSYLDTKKKETQFFINGEEPIIYHTTKMKACQDEFRQIHPMQKLDEVKEPPKSRAGRKNGNKKLVTLTVSATVEMEEKDLEFNNLYSRIEMMKLNFNSNSVRAEVSYGGKTSSFKVA